MQEINAEIAKIIDARRNSLSEAIVSRQYELQPEIWEPYGDKGRELSLRDSNHHFSYLVEALNQSDPTLFGDYVVWLKQLFNSIKIPAEALPKMLECTEHVLRETLSPEMARITDKYIAAATGRINDELVDEPSFITADTPLHVLAATVLSSLIQPVLGYYSDRHPIPWLMPFGYPTHCASVIFWSGRSFIASLSFVLSIFARTTVARPSDAL